MLRKVYRTYMITGFIMLLLPAIFGLQIPAAAHPLNNGYSYIQIEDNRVNYSLFIPGVSLPFVDSNGNGMITDAEMADGRSKLQEYLASRLILENDAGPMEIQLSRAEPEDRDGVPGASMEIIFTSSQPSIPLSIYYNLLFDDIDPGHLNFVTIAAGDEMDQYMFEDSDRTYTFDIVRDNGARGLPVFYLKLGVKHIFAGIDHLVFLLSLLLVVSRWKDALALVTAFTGGHSITLILAAMGWLPVNAVLVEAGIALTICYSAAVNPFVRRVGSRWTAALLLGLIHGLGFAGALGETGLPPGRMVSSLLAFNLGVEAGQIVLVAAAMPVLLLLRRFNWYYQWVVVWGSGCIFLLGLYWFLVRIGILPV
jgi:hypothetical protein